MQRPVDLLVIGGGVIGLAVAREAALSGMTVRLLERGATGGEASGASAGMLAAQLEAHHPGPLLPLCLASRDLYPPLVEALRDEIGIDVDLRREGALAVARGAAAADDMVRSHRFQKERGLPVELLEAADLRRAEPELTEAAILGLLMPREFSLDPPRLLAALRASAERLGAQVLADCAVERITVSSRGVTGVLAADGTAHAAPAVLVAAGAWSGSIAVEGTAAPESHPVRGQMLCFQAPGLLRHIVYGGTCYLVPRGDGRILAGSTMENAGFDRRVTAEGLSTLAAGAVAIVPGIGPAAFHRAWAGLRPASSDGLPVIGAGAVPGLFYAFGHLRNGIVLAPLTARAIVRLVRGEEPEVDLDPFSPRRFASAGRG